MNSISTPNDADGTSVDDPSEADVFVLGDGSVGVAVARRLREDGYSTTLIADGADPDDDPAIRADPADVRALDDVGLGPSSTVIVATPSDGRNLLLAQLVRVRFGVDRVLVLANEPDRVAVLSDAGHDPVCATSRLADALVERV